MDAPQHYQAIDQNSWTGRADSHANERLFQIIQTIDLDKQTLTQGGQQHIAIIGFCSDEGVRRNLGRQGAADGPQALRQAIVNLPIHNDRIRIIDLGNILCENTDLEQAQNDLAGVIAQALQQSYRPCVLGGGHEVAWAHFQGIRRVHPDLKLGIINFDAHFDLRPLPKSGYGNSGTPFTQIADYSQAQQLDFAYLCIGIQPSANTRSLYDRAEQLRVQTIDAEMIRDQEVHTLFPVLDEFINSVDAVYLTFCLDVFAAAFAPGVSAPQAVGLTPWQAMPLLQHVLKSGKVISFDIAELAPNYDQQNRTAALAAQIVYNYIHYQ